MTSNKLTDAEILRIEFIEENWREDIINLTDINFLLDVIKKLTTMRLPDSHNYNDMT